MTAALDDLRREIPDPNLSSSAAPTTSGSSHGGAAHSTSLVADYPLSAKGATTVVDEKVGSVCRFLDLDSVIQIPQSVAQPVSPFLSAERTFGKADGPKYCLQLDFEVEVPVSALEASPRPAAYEATSAPEMSSVEWPGLTGALFAMDIETCAEDQNKRLVAQVLNKLAKIERGLSAKPRSRNKKQPKCQEAAQTADDRLKGLHLSSASEAAEQMTLKELGKLLRCSPSAFIRGAYYQGTLKSIREEVRASKKLRRASGQERGRAESRQAIRDRRTHIDSYDPVDKHIDKTWDERQGGQFKGK